MSFKILTEINGQTKKLTNQKCRLNMQGEFDGTSWNICGHMVVFE